MKEREAREKSVSVVVINYNAGEELADCLQTVFSQRFDGAIDVLVLDNQSSDHSLELARKRFPSLRIIENQDNIGFAAGMNQGIAETTGQYILSLNFDVRLATDYVAQMVAVLQKHPVAGMATGKLYKVKDGDYRILDSTGINFFQMLPSDRGENKKDIGQFDHTEPVFGASGAAALYRRSMLEAVAIGGEVFDEDFFMFVEDVDLAWRAQLAGWDCLFVPQAEAIHQRGTTRRSEKKLIKQYHQLGYRNRYLAIFKNLDKEIMRGHRSAIRYSEVRTFLRVVKHYGLFTAIGTVTGALVLYRKMKNKRRQFRQRVQVRPGRVEKFIFF